jgi:hypothetical protein
MNDQVQIQNNSKNYWAILGFSFTVMSILLLSVYCILMSITDPNIMLFNFVDKLYFGQVSILLLIIGLILSIIGLKKSSILGSHRLSLAGLIISALLLFVGIIFFVILLLTAN